jgi:hypothetical protein
MILDDDPRYRTAARAYFVYGVVYWLGGAWLWLHDVGRGSLWSVVWILVGAGLVVLIPYLLRRPRRWFERWIFTRRDFARIVTVLMALRVLAVARVVAREETASVQAPWGGVLTYRAGGAVFILVTLVALILVARAAWADADERP